LLRRSSLDLREQIVRQADRTFYVIPRSIIADGEFGVLCRYVPSLRSRSSQILLFTGSVACAGRLSITPSSAPSALHREAGSFDTRPHSHARNDAIEREMGFLRNQGKAIMANELK